MASVAFPELSKTLTVKDGTKYGYIKVEPKGNNPTLLFLHGYPSSSYLWHYQIKQCQDEGYGAIVPDLLGYGDTDHPSNVEAYNTTIIAKQVIDIVDCESLDTVIGIAHDWGSTLLSVLARHYPERFSLLIWMAVAYSPTQAPYIDIDAINARSIAAIGRPVLGYWRFNNSPEAATITEKADPETLYSLIFPAAPEMWATNLGEPDGMASWFREKKKGELAAWISREQVEMHEKILKMSGYTGPLNWYKQAMAGITAKTESNVTDEQKKIKTPTLFIGAERDVICMPAMQETSMKPWMEDLTVESVYTGHWCMLEKPDDTWALVDKFIKARL